MNYSGGCRRVRRRDFVHNVASLREGEESVPESGRNPHLCTISRVEVPSDPLPEGWRRTPQIHGDIEDRAFDHPNELALRVGRELIVDSAKDALQGNRLVVLHECDRSVDGRIECLFVVGLAECASPVSQDRRGNNKNTIEIGSLDGKGITHRYREDRYASTTSLECPEAFT